ncbi:MAG: hypothetical protein ACRENS_09060 [Candidatus Eiseniibacteriota bacterium]
MPYRVELSSDGQIIRVAATAKFDFDSSLPVFADVARMLEVRPEAGILVDVREIDYTPSVSDIRQFVSRHEEMTRNLRNPHALVTAKGVNFGMAMMMCTLIEVSGGKSHAFTDVGEAERWLLDALHQRSSSQPS